MKWINIDSKLACILLCNICTENGDSISHKLGLQYGKRANPRKSLQELRNLKMVSARCYVDTYKGAAVLRNNICNYFRNKNEL